MAEQICAFSGGKDSTAMVVRLAELGESFTCLFTPTRNELPELFTHIETVMQMIDRRLVMPPAPTLDGLIDFHEALPNWRMRWCTRQIKIEPCIDYLDARPGSTLCVGLRADEESREGIYGDHATYRYPLREWGWKLADVLAYLDEQDIQVPSRTDCALCFYQRLGDWYRLWRDRPQEFEKGVGLERRIGNTFRSPSRDTWPAALADLRAEFEKGRIPRGVDDKEQPCRVCTL